ncbi:collagenase [Chitinimonas sp. DQS-5]|uniref:microbial collagenase n=2 Tax=Parachitinimonas caeni TaxID=3031301 RepID=A0ABT7DWP8_9NEIS|nr:collagenase [Parachitinimonas caeni]
MKYPNCHALALMAVAVASSFAAYAVEAPTPASITPVTEALLHSTQRSETRTDPKPMQDPTFQPPVRMFADANCDVAAFARADTAGLAKMITSSTTSCMNQLFGVTGSNAQAIFKEAKLVAALDELTRLAPRYDGTNKEGIYQVVMFLRAGYYVQWYNKKDVGDYGAAAKAAQQRALDAFFANKAIWTISKENGDILGETVTLIDSAGENARFMPVIKEMLRTFGAEQRKVSSVRNAYNNAFTVYFRGHQNADFKALMKADGSYATAVFDFYRRNLNMRGTGDEFMLANAARELARFLQYPERKAEVQPMVRTMITDNALGGSGASIWMAAVDGANYYDKDNCSYYGTCNYKADLAAKILPITHKCGPTLTIRAQEMTAEQLAGACADLAAEEKLFHYGTFGNTDPLASTPVPNDNNTALEVVVFDDYNNYNTYAGPLFGISTNNGGMYLEGNPAKPGNQARFIAHEAQWKRPLFEVWNLKHEYIHYLDGRYNAEGDFGKSQSVAMVWWGEGVAEYYSYQNNNTGAVNEARKGTYSLSTLFKTTYANADSNRIYAWGYLAVRYMHERQRPFVENMLLATRRGDFAGYQKMINDLGTSLDADFAAWLKTVATGGEFAGGKPSNGGGGNNTNTAPLVTGLSDVKVNVGQTIPVLNFTVSDKETAADQLKVNVQINNTNLIPASGMVLGGTGSQRTLTLLPNAKATGEAVVTVVVSDGKLTSQQSIKVTIGSGTSSNTAPKIAGLRDINASAGQAASLNFTVSDAETAAGQLKVSVASSNTGLIPTDALILGGSNEQRTLTIKPAAGKTGEGMVTVSVSDGSLTSQSSFKVTVAGTGGVNTAPKFGGLRDVSVTAGQTGTLNFTVSDQETPAEKLAVFAVSSDPSILPPGALEISGKGTERTLSLKPVGGKGGEVNVLMGVFDGELFTQGMFNVKVSAATGNTAPRIVGLKDINASAGTATTEMFGVLDQETPSSKLKVTATAADSNLIPADGLVLTGTDAARVLTVKPAAGKTGETTVTVTVDDGQLSTKSDIKVKVAGETGDSCPKDRKDALADGCTRSNIASNGSSWYWLWVPKGVQKLTINTSGGSGDVDLYVKSQNWPSETKFDGKSTNAGNEESVVLDNPTASNGEYYHIMMRAKQPYSGVSINAKFN